MIGHGPLSFDAQALASRRWAALAASRAAMVRSSAASRSAVNTRARARSSPASRASHQWVLSLEALVAGKITLNQPSKSRWIAGTKAKEKRNACAEIAHASA